MALAASSSAAATTAAAADADAAELPSGAELEHLAALRECLYTFLRSAECTFCALELVSPPALGPATGWLRGLVAECVAFGLAPADALHELRSLNAGFLRVADALRDGDKVVDAFRAHLIAAGRLETRPRPPSAATAATEGPVAKDAGSLRRPVHRVTQSHFGGGASSHSPSLSHSHSHSHSHARSYSTATARPASPFGGASSLQARVLRPPSASAALASVAPPATNRPASASPHPASRAASVSVRSSSIAESGLFEPDHPSPQNGSVDPERTPLPPGIAELDADPTPRPVDSQSGSEQGHSKAEEQQRQPEVRAEPAAATTAEPVSSLSEHTTSDTAPSSEQLALATRADVELESGAAVAVAVLTAAAPSVDERKTPQDPSAADEHALQTEVPALPSAAHVEEAKDAPTLNSTAAGSEAEAPHIDAPATAPLPPQPQDEDDVSDAETPSDTAAAAAAPSHSPTLAVIYSASSVSDEAHELVQSGSVASSAVPLEDGATGDNVLATGDDAMAEEIEPTAPAESPFEPALDSDSAAVLTGVTASDQLPSSGVTAASAPIDAATSEVVIPTAADAPNSATSDFFHSAAPVTESPADGFPTGPPADLQPPAPSVGETNSGSA